MRIVLAALLIVTAGAAHAQDRDVTTSGQPICTQRDELQEAILAMLKKDVVWLKSLKSCILAKKGLKIATIEEYGDNEDINVAKVRVFGFGSSFVGYTIDVKN